MGLTNLTSPISKAVVPTWITTNYRMLEGKCQSFMVCSSQLQLRSQLYDFWGLCNRNYRCFVHNFLQLNEFQVSHISHKQLSAGDPENFIVEVNIVVVYLDLKPFFAYFSDRIKESDFNLILRTGEK